MLKDWRRTGRSTTPHTYNGDAGTKQKQTCWFGNRDQWLIWIVARFFIVFVFVPVVQPPDPPCRVVNAGEAALGMVRIGVLVLERVVVKRRKPFDVRSGETPADPDVAPVVGAPVGIVRETFVQISGNVHRQAVGSSRRHSEDRASKCECS